MSIFMTSSFLEGLNSLKLYMDQVGSYWFPWSAQFGGMLDSILFGLRRTLTNLLTQKEFDYYRLDYIACLQLHLGYSVLNLIIVSDELISFSDTSRHNLVRDLVFFIRISHH